MYYLKLQEGKTVIEFHNNWLGQETVIVAGKVVSKKYSVWGIDHPFSAVEDGQEVKYVLITKVDSNLQVVIDLIKEGQMIRENVKVPIGFSGKKAQNREKAKGVQLLNNYDLDDAIITFQKALDFDRNDPEIYFHLACAYSVMERPLEAFENLKESVSNNLQDLEAILNHDMLAFLRMHPGFESFHDSKYHEIDLSAFPIKQRPTEQDN